MIDSFVDTKRRTNTCAVGPEEVLLQITLAFMVFLGFLVSDEVANKAALQYQMDGLEQGLTEVDKRNIVELGKLRFAEQKYVLLEKWWKKKNALPLFRLTAFYNDANSPLHKSSIKELREDPSFRELHKHSNLYFSRKSKDHLKDEIDGLIEAITKKTQAELAILRRTQVGLKRTGKNSTSSIATQSAELRKGGLRIENVDVLRGEIEKDFDDQRAKVRDIQDLAFGRLLQMSFERAGDTSLEQTINEWDKDLPMLPEVKESRKKILVISSSSN